MAKYLRQADAVFLRMDGKRTPMYVGCLLTFKLPAKAPKDFLDELLAALRNQKLEPPFSYRLANPRLARIAPAWEEARRIDPEYHVRHSALPKPGGERELGTLIARLHSNPMDFRRPLWEVHLIEGLGPQLDPKSGKPLSGNRFAVYTKVHHALADGATAMRLLQGWLTEDPLDRDVTRPFLRAQPKSRAKKKPDLPTRLERFIYAAGNQIAAGWELARALRELNDRELHPEGGMYSALETPRTPFNVAVTAHRRLATQVYDFERFRRIKDATGASINDIALAITGGAMRRYLMEYNALPDRTMIASVPVALPRTDGSRNNAVAGFVVPLATDQHDPVKRLARIRKVTANTKAELTQLSPEALDQYSAIGFAPMVIGQMAGINARLPPMCNITVSNVAGPKKLLYLGGAQLESIFPVSLLFDGYALNLTLVSYADRFCLGFVGCRNALPHLQRLAVYTGLALDELEEAVAAT